METKDVLDIWDKWVKNYIYIFSIIDSDTIIIYGMG